LNLIFPAGLEKFPYALYGEKSIKISISPGTKKADPK